jgi:hypothetical protein
MKPSARRLEQLTRARREAIKSRWPEPFKLANAKRFVFAILVNAGRYHEIRDVFLWNDIVPPSEATF